MGDLRVQHFQRNGVISQESFDILGPRVPPEIVALWRECGQGYIGREGYIHLLDPVWVWQKMADSVTRPADITPVFVTGMGDVIVHRPNLFVEGPPQFDVIFFRYGTYVPLDTNSVEFFLRMLEDPSYLRDELASTQYSEAIARTGVPRMNECLIHTPLLGLGGPDSSETLQPGGMAEFWALRTDLLGKVEMWSDEEWRAVEERQKRGREMAQAAMPELLESLRRKGLIPPEGNA